MLTPRRRELVWRVTRNHFCICLLVGVQVTDTLIVKRKLEGAPWGGLFLNSSCELLLRSITCLLVSFSYGSHLDWAPLLLSEHILLMIASGRQVVWIHRSVTDLSTKFKASALLLVIVHYRYNYQRILFVCLFFKYLHFFFFKRFLFEGGR